jgi:glucokinase
VSGQETSPKRISKPLVPRPPDDYPDYQIDPARSVGRDRADPPPPPWSAVKSPRGCQESIAAEGDRHTGIGGGSVINGCLHLGMVGTGSELGHQTIDMNSLICGCGNRGCVEAYASGPAITAMGLKAITQGLTASIGELVDYDLNRITPEVFAQATQASDQIAQDIYERAGTYIGIGGANVLVSVGPCKVVIGGGVAQAGDLLLDPIRRTEKDRVQVMPVEPVQIVPAELGPNAGIIGAAVWASQNIGSSQQLSSR